MTIWIGTSGWVYDHWIGRLYPPGLPKREWLSAYAREFPTVEINRSYYRLPTRDQFRSWADQAARAGGLVFAVKASRYITHLKKLRDTGDALDRLIEAAEGLGDQLGPFLYQLPPKWRADPERLEQFVARLPSSHRAAFEFRDPSWFRQDVLSILERSGCALAVGIGGAHPTPLDLPPVGPFRYVRFHSGAYGVGLTDDELSRWAEWLTAGPASGQDAYVYFNNDAEGHAVDDARRLRRLLGALAAEPGGGVRQ